MSKRSIAFLPDPVPENSRATVCLDEQLAVVMEEEGRTMSSSIGIRYHVSRAKKARQKRWKTAFLSAPLPSQEDAIAVLDVLSLNLLRDSNGTQPSQSLPITFSAHERSRFILSLREFSRLFAPPDEDRNIWREALTAAREPKIQAPRSDIFSTLSGDVALPPVFPYVEHEQFTSSDFWNAYRQSYGRFHRLLDQARMFMQEIGSLFQRIERIERIEQRFADEARDTLTVFEVPRWSLVRGLAGFLGLALLVTLPAQAIGLYRSTKQSRENIEQAGTRALEDVAQAKQQKDIHVSGDALKRASLHFREADAALRESYVLALGIASVLPQQYRSARALLEVGDKSSEAARLLALGVEKVFSDGSRRLDERLDVLGAYARGILPLLIDASKAATTIDPDVLPQDKRQEFSELRGRLEESVAAIREFAGLADTLSRFVGKDEARRYLVIFQNQTELRPTGGFMGSLAEVTLDRGEIKNIFVPPGGTYDLKGQLTARITSPSPLHLINPLWQFQDANWNPDFSAAAQKISWFWSKAGQPTVDGIIAINASVVEKLLGITGPIEIPAYGKTISQENFLLETQKAVELEYDKTENAPKKFIGDLAPLLLERLKALPREDMIKAILLVSESLETKDVQVAFRDPSEEALAERYGWSGQMKETVGDSLAIIEANIAGQKTDGVIQEKVEHHVTLQDDGRLINEVTLTRTHTGRKGDLFQGVRNVSFVRVYVPEGSKLLSADGFQRPTSSLFKQPDEFSVPDPDIEQVERTSQLVWGQVQVTRENSRTVFGGWLQLDPGQTQTLRLRYQLPFTLRDIAKRLDLAPQPSGQGSEAYMLLLTSQSGRPRTIHHTLHLPDDRTLEWSRGAQASSSGMELFEEWNRDKVVAALVRSHESKE